MIQWFRGKLVASYVAEPRSPGTPSLRGAAPHLALRVYRAAAFELSLLDPPVAPPLEGLPETADAPSAAPEPAVRGVFHQDTIEDAHLRGIRGPASRFHGPVFDVQISDLLLSHQTKHNGKAYGRMTGTLIAWCELPDRPARQAPAAGDPTPPDTPQGPRESRPDARAGELTFEAPTTELDEPAAEPLTAHARLRAEKEARDEIAAEEDAEEADEEDAEEADEEDAAPARPLRPHSGRGVAHVGPLSAAGLLIALGLGLASGLEPALLWCAFLIPTLLARALFHGVLRDSTGLRAFAFVLVLGQVLAASGLISGWWGSSCRHLELVPLLSIIAVLFPSGLLPSALPLVANAAGLALVLGLWSSAPESKCQDGRPRPRAAAELPTVKDPGVPRTNQDGSWPKRPPG